MMMFAGILFFLSFVGIIALFTLKAREEASGRHVAPQLRDALDTEAIRIKELLFAAELDLKKIPPLVVYWAHVLLHRMALEFARAARSASRQAHALADFVSHKRNFQRTVTRSEFLKKMGERKNGMPGQGQDEANGSNRQEEAERVEF